MRTAQRRTSKGLLAVCVTGAVALFAPAGASAVGALTYDACLGAAAAGCTSVPGNPLQPAGGVAVGPDGSVYETASSNQEAAGIVSRLSAGPQGRLSFNRCLSDDGTGGDGTAGACVDIPGTGIPLFGPDGLAVSPNGRSIYVTSFAGTLSHLNFEDGQFTWDACMSDDGSSGQCVKGPQNGPGRPFLTAEGLSVSPNRAAPNSSVYFSGADLASTSLSHVFADPNNGKLNYDGCVSNDGSGGTCTPLPAIGNSLGTEVNGGPSPGATATAINPQGTALYAVSTSAGTVSQFAISPPDGGGITGRVGCLRAANNNVAGCDGIGPQTGNPLSEVSSAAVSANGSSVFTASRNGTVSHFFADAAGKGIISFDGCVSADGTDGNGVGGACTKVSPQSAQVSALTPSPLSGVDHLAVSPDGKTLYVAAGVASTVSWFSIAPAGQLTFQGCTSDNIIPGCTHLSGAPLKGADSVAVSPDGASVYVSSSNGVAHFFRATGGGGVGGGGGGGGGSNHTLTVTAKIGNQLITLVTSFPSACVAKSGSLSASLTSSAIPASTAAKLRSTGAAFSIDRGVRHVHSRTGHRRGKKVVITTVTYTPNHTVGRLPANVSLKLAGLRSGSHAFKVTVSYHETVTRHGHRRTISLSKTLSLTFKVC
jgi:sugar lactone lactonase YvrE